MARIRTIKPEFWDSPSTRRAGPWARLLYIAMWNWADDFGRGTANLKELEGFAFPNDSVFSDRSGNTVHFRSLVAEVSACFDVVLYEVDGRDFYAIPAWDKHQRNERRSKGSRHPSPDDPAAIILDLTRGDAETPRTSATQERKYRASDAETPRTSGPGTGEQGNRGKDSCSSDADAPAERVAPLDPDGFAGWWQAYPRKVGKGQAVKAYRAALRKTTPTVLAAAVQSQRVRLMAKGPEFCPHPATWLNGERWADQAPTPVIDIEDDRSWMM